MTQDILMIALDQFTDWTPSYLAYAIGMHGRSKYRARIVGMTDDPVVSAGGLRLLPDYDIRRLPQEYAGVVLLGGIGWMQADDLLRETIGPLLNDAIGRNLPVGGIGFGADALAACGILNNVIHTGNSLGELKAIGKENYTGENNFREVAAVRDSNVVTAGAAVPGPFARAYTMTLDIDQNTAGSMYARRIELSANPVIIDMDSLRAGK